MPATLKTKPRPSNRRRANESLIGILQSWSAKKSLVKLRFGWAQASENPPGEHRFSGKATRSKDATAFIRFLRDNGLTARPSKQRGIIEIQQVNYEQLQKLLKRFGEKFQKPVNSPKKPLPPLRPGANRKHFFDGPSPLREPLLRRRKPASHFRRPH